jgi:hypothetical protein
MCKFTPFFDHRHFFALSLSDDPSSIAVVAHNRVLQWNVSQNVKFDKRTLVHFKVAAWVYVIFKFFAALG